MIDYEKLRKAHELTKKLPFESYSFDCWCCTGLESGFFYTLTFEDNENMSHEYESQNIDELIAKLQELTKPQPKFQIGQEVWLVGNFGEPITAKVLGKMGGDVDLGFKDGTCRYGVLTGLYPTKQSLIEAQIAMWLKMNEECQHESDGNCYTSYPATLKCKKCGEFYK